MVDALPAEPAFAVALRVSHRPIRRACEAALLAGELAGELVWVFARRRLLASMGTVSENPRVGGSIPSLAICSVAWTYVEARFASYCMPADIQSAAPVVTSATPPGTARGLRFVRRSVPVLPHPRDYLASRT